MHMLHQHSPAARQKWKMHMARLGAGPTQQTLGRHHLGGDACLVWK